MKVSTTAWPFIKESRWPCSIVLVRAEASVETAINQRVRNAVRMKTPGGAGPGCSDSRDVARTAGRGGDPGTVDCAAMAQRNGGRIRSRHQFVGSAASGGVERFGRAAGVHRDASEAWVPVHLPGSIKNR